MSGERESPAARLLAVGRVAVALGIGTRHVDRLVERGVLPQPVVMAGRRLWRAEDVERARLQRLQHRPTNRQHARRGPSVARRVRQERTVLARVLLHCLEVAGPVVMLGVMRSHGAEHGIRGFTVDQLSSLTAELEWQTKLILGLR